MSLIIAGCLLFAFGLVLLIVEERRVRAHDRWCAGAEKAAGVVSRMGLRGWHSRQKPSDFDEVSTVPVVRFRAARGQEYEFDAPEAPSREGAAVQVAYDAALPSDARLLVSPRKFGCAFFLLVIAVALFICAAVGVNPFASMW